MGFQSLTSGLDWAKRNLSTWDKKIPSARGPPGNCLVGPDYAAVKAEAAGGGRLKVSLETRRKRPEAALRLAAAGWSRWGWSPRRKPAATRKRTRLRPWSGRRRGRQAARPVRPGLRSPAASLGVNEKGGAGGGAGRWRRPLGCDRPRLVLFLSFSRLGRESCSPLPGVFWPRSRNGWLRLIGLGWTCRL